MFAPDRKRTGNSRGHPRVNWPAAARIGEGLVGVSVRARAGGCVRPSLKKYFSARYSVDSASTLGPA